MIGGVYGPYHIARAAGLERAGCEVWGLSFCRTDESYPFFNLSLERHVMINDCDLSEVNPMKSFVRTLGILRTLQPDLVIPCGYERPESLAAVVYAKTRRRGKSRPKVILTLDNTEHDRVRRPSVERVKSTYLRAFDGFSVGGFRTRDYLVQLGVNPKRIQPGWCCVDNAEIAALSDESREKPALGPASGYLLSVSRFVSKKNLPRLVRAYAGYRRQLNPSLAPWPLVILGDGPDRPAVVEAVRSHDLEDSVILPGATSSLADICNYYAHARAFVMPSIRNEQWGSAVNEAMAAGLPVLVSERCGCAPDLVFDGVNGFCFNPEDSEALAEQIVWLHEHEAEIERMGIESKRIVSRYSPDQFASNVLALAGI